MHKHCKNKKINDSLSTNVKTNDPYIDVDLGVCKILNQTFDILLGKKGNDFQF